MTAIDTALAQLSRLQQPDGSFLSFTDTTPAHAFFPTPLILSALGHIPDHPTLNPVKQKAAAYILTQKSDQWTFNYWARKVPENRTHPYPDDLDDTFCALSALHVHDPHLIDGKAQARIVALLAAVETDEGGPYRTWVVPATADPAWRDVDVAVNSNIAYYLFLNDIVLDSLTRLTHTAIKNQTLTSPYYIGIQPVAYFISRWYRGPARELLVRHLHHQTFTTLNPLELALTATALLNLGQPPAAVTPLIQRLCQIDRQWAQPHPFVMELSTASGRFIMGSSALTLAFCLEALHRYQVLQASAAPANLTLPAHFIRLHQTIVKRVIHRLTPHLPDSPGIPDVFHRLLDHDRAQPIVLLPALFASCLQPQLSRRLSRSLLVDSGEATFYGWLAYTIYDDFLDDEGHPPLLSLANLALRELTRIFTQVTPEFTPFFQTVMDQLDAANTWEVTHCRFDPARYPAGMSGFSLPRRFPPLSDRSLGHALGPLALLFSLGYSATSPEIKHTLAFFRHYLTARQLNDDAHDWEKDLQRGQVNAVGLTLLKATAGLKVSTPTDLQEIFWAQVITPTCRQITAECNRAAAALQKLTLLNDPSPFLALLDPIKASAAKALTERRQVLDFLQVI